jgi:hypothetical protein
LRSPRSPFVHAALLALLGLGLAGAAGCGKKGDPLPPIRPIPATPDDFRVIQRGDRLLLSLPYPSTTVAGTPLSEVTGATVWSAVRTIPPGAEPPPPPDQRQFGAVAGPLRVLEGPELQEAVRGDRIAATLTLADLTGAGAAGTGEGERPIATLAVKTRGPTGEDSAFSDLVTFPVREAPAPPKALTLEGESRGVRLRWEYPEELTAPEPEEDPAPAEDAEDGGSTPPDPSEQADQADQTEPAGEGAPAEASDGAPADDLGDPDDLADPDDQVRGFNVYRRAASERTYGEPLRSLPRRARTFVDESAIFGQRYIYAVSAVAERRPVLVESDLGEEVEISYRDRFPPDAPTGVLALAQEGPRVRVVWRPVDASDLAGYRVYRLDPESGEPRPLHEEPVTRTELVDEDVTPGVTYTYRVRAVDRSGNESELSEPAGATVR